MPINGLAGTGQYIDKNNDDDDDDDDDVDDTVD